MKWGIISSKKNAADTYALLLLRNESKVAYKSAKMSKFKWFLIGRTTFVTNQNHCNDSKYTDWCIQNCKINWFDHASSAHGVSVFEIMFLKKNKRINMTRESQIERFVNKQLNCRIPAVFCSSGITNVWQFALISFPLFFFCSPFYWYLWRTCAESVFISISFLSASKIQPWWSCSKGWFTVFWFGWKSLKPIVCKIWALATQADRVSH